MQNNKIVKKHDMYIEFKFLKNLIIRTFWLEATSSRHLFVFFICILEYVATYEKSIKET